MEAPFAEELTRLLLALVVTAAFVMLVVMTRLVWSRPSRWVALFMSFTLGLYMVWRWFVLWLGTQAETPDYQTNWEPTVRSVGNWLLILLITSVGFMALHHVHELRKGRQP